jgi:hypothetical protein
VQGGVGGVAFRMQDLIMRAGGELANDCSGQHLLDAVGLRLVDECGNRERLDVLGHRDVVSCGVIAASGQ